MTPAEQDDWFDALYPALAASPRWDELHRQLYGKGWAGQIGLADARALNRLVEAASLRRGCVVLELGCGNGGLGQWLAFRYGVRVIGLDRGLGGLRLAVANGWVDAVRATLGQLPLVSSSVDSIVALDAFGADWSMLAVEAARVLRPNAGFAALAYAAADQALQIGTSLSEAGFRSWHVDDLSAEGLAALDAWVGLIADDPTLHSEVRPVPLERLVDEQRDWRRRVASGQVRRLLISARVEDASNPQ